MDIFVINIDCSENIEPDLLKSFQKKAFSSDVKLKEHSLAYLMLDRILREVYAVENREIEYKDKKPYLKNKKKFFSISHSNEYIVLAFSDYECGVDIEEIKERDFQAISKRMKFNSATLEEFYVDWTKYEAEYKLGEKAQGTKCFKLEDYMIFACSNNKKEKFELFIQN